MWYYYLHVYHEIDGNYSMRMERCIHVLKKPNAIARLFQSNEMLPSFPDRRWSPPREIPLLEITIPANNVSNTLVLVL